jgi:hypothetical protein
MKQVIMLAFLLVGCATKHYPQASAISAEETAALDCQTLNQEIIKTQNLQSEIQQTGDFNALTVLGFIGDFGLGNGIAKYSASHKADTRLNQLQQIKNARCSQRLS